MRSRSARPPEETPRRRAVAITFLWGASCTETFLETVLPSLLSPGNLGESPPAQWRFFTTAADWNTVTRHRLYPRIEPLARPSFEDFAKVGHVESGYAGMWRLYRLAVSEPWDADAALLFLPPDALLADGTIWSAAQRLGEGWRAVVVPRPRAIKEEIEALARRHLVAHGAVSPGWLAATAAAAWHPLTLQSFRDAPNFTIWPANTIDLDGRDLVVRGYHVPPLMVHPRRHASEFENIDLDFCGLAVPDWSEIYLPAGSDEMFQVDLTHRRQCDFLLGRGPLDRVAVEAWVSEEDRGGYNRWLFNHPYRVVGGAPAIDRGRDDGPITGVQAAA